MTSHRCRSLKVRQAYGTAISTSRKKLDFDMPKQPLPLHNKSIYLDIKNSKQTDLLEEQLKKLGAKIEKFLSRDVNYVISTSASTKADEKPNSWEESLNSPSFGGVPSPFSCGPSPSGQTECKKTVISRGKALAQIACSKSKASTVVASAEKLGIKVVQLDVAYKWAERELKKFEAESKKRNGKIKENKGKKPLSQSKDSSKTKYKILRGCFLKFEASNQHYKPIKSEFDHWPKLNLTAPPGICPFGEAKLKVQFHYGARKTIPALQHTTPVNTEAVTVGSRHPKMKPKEEDTVLAQSVSAVPELVAVPIVTTGDIKRNLNFHFKRNNNINKQQGYCDCCEVKFNNFDQHVNGDTHRAFARDKTNYESLDALIAEVPSTIKFLQSVLLKHCAQVQNEALGDSIPPPISPLTNENMGSPYQEEAVLSLNTPQHCGPEVSPSKDPIMFTDTDQMSKKEATPAEEEIVVDNRPHAVVIRRPMPSGMFTSPRRRQSTPSKRPWVQECSMIFRDSPIASLQPSVSTTPKSVYVNSSGAGSNGLNLFSRLSMDLEALKCMGSPKHAVELNNKCQVDYISGDQYLTKSIENRGVDERSSTHISDINLQGNEDKCHTKESKNNLLVSPNKYRRANKLLFPPTSIKPNVNIDLNPSYKICHTADCHVGDGKETISNNVEKAGQLSPDCNSNCGTHTVSSGDRTMRRELNKPSPELMSDVENIVKHGLENLWLTPTASKPVDLSTFNLDKEHLSKSVDIPDARKWTVEDGTEEHESLTPYKTGDCGIADLVRKRGRQSKQEKYSEKECSTKTGNPQPDLICPTHTDNQSHLKAIILDQKSVENTSSLGMISCKIGLLNDVINCASVVDSEVISNSLIMPSSHLAVNHFVMKLGEQRQKEDIIKSDQEGLNRKDEGHLSPVQECDQVDERNVPRIDEDANVSESEGMLTNSVVVEGKRNRKTPKSVEIHSEESMNEVKSFTRQNKQENSTEEYKHDEAANTDNAFKNHDSTLAAHFSHSEEGTITISDVNESQEPNDVIEWSKNQPLQCEEVQSSRRCSKNSFLNCSPTVVSHRHKVIESFTNQPDIQEREKSIMIQLFESKGMTPADRNTPSQAHNTDEVRISDLSVKISCDTGTAAQVDSNQQSENNNAVSLSENILGSMKQKSRFCKMFAHEGIYANSEEENEDLPLRLQDISDSDSIVVPNIADRVKNRSRIKCISESVTKGNSTEGVRKKSNKKRDNKANKKDTLSVKKRRQSNKITDVSKNKVPLSSSKDHGKVGGQDGMDCKVVVPNIAENVKKRRSCTMFNHEGQYANNGEGCEGALVILDKKVDNRDMLKNVSKCESDVKVDDTRCTVTSLTREQSPQKRSSTDRSPAVVIRRKRPGSTVLGKSLTEVDWGRFHKKKDWSVMDTSDAEEELTKWPNSCKYNSQDGFPDNSKDCFKESKCDQQQSQKEILQVSSCDSSMKVNVKQAMYSPQYLKNGDCDSNSWKWKRAIYSPQYCKTEDGEDNSRKQKAKQNSSVPSYLTGPQAKECNITSSPLHVNRSPRIMLRLRKNSNNEGYSSTIDEIYNIPSDALTANSEPYQNKTPDKSFSQKHRTLQRGKEERSSVKHQSGSESIDLQSPIKSAKRKRDLSPRGDLLKLKSKISKRIHLDCGNTLTAGRKISDVPQNVNEQLSCKQERAQSPCFSSPIAHKHPKSPLTPQKQVSVNLHHGQTESKSPVFKFSRKRSKVTQEFRDVDSALKQSQPASISNVELSPLTLKEAGLEAKIVTDESRPIIVKSVDHNSSTDQVKYGCGDQDLTSPPETKRRKLDDRSHCHFTLNTNLDKVLESEQGLVPLKGLPVSPNVDPVSNLTNVEASEIDAANCDDAKWSHNKVNEDIETDCNSTDLQDCFEQEDENDNSSEFQELHSEAEDFLTFVPALSSSCKPTDSSWGDICDSYLSTSIKRHGQLSPLRSPGRGSRNSYNPLSPFKLPGVFSIHGTKETPQKTVQKGQNTPKKGAYCSPKMHNGNDTRITPDKLGRHKDANQQSFTSPVKREYRQQNMAHSQHVHQIDGEISFNYISPQRINGSPTRSQQRLDKPLKRILFGSSKSQYPP